MCGGRGGAALYCILRRLLLYGHDYCPSIDLRLYARTALKKFSVEKCDPFLQKGSEVSGTNTNYRRRSEGQSLRPPLDCPTSTAQNVFFLLRYMLDCYIK